MNEIENQTGPVKNRRVLTAEEVAELCRVSLATIYRTIKLGRIRPLAGLRNGL